MNQMGNLGGLSRFDKVEETTVSRVLLTRNRKRTRARYEFL